MSLMPDQSKIFCAMIFQPIELHMLYFEIDKKISCGEAVDIDFNKKFKMRCDLTDLCCNLQMKFQDDILTPFRVDRNGEVEVVLNSNKYVESILSEVEKSFGSLIFGVWENTLQIFDSDNIDICDGPAFWDAREEITANALHITDKSLIKKKHI